jgi:SH3 domain-containing YSC84-like protein 1
MSIKHFATYLLAAGLCFGARTADERLNDAADVINDIMAAPDKGIPQDLLNKSACVVVVPGVKKGAFIVGAKYGKGFISCRKPRGWSAPAAVIMEGGSFGFQIGASETDVVMLVMNDSGVKKLLGSKFTIGGDASVAGGPVGRSADAQTDAQMHAELLTYSRSRGLFAGISLQGATLRPDSDWNKELYGASLSNQDIVLGTTAPPAGAARFLATLNKYSSRPSK